MPFFHFNNIEISGIACAVPGNKVQTESYKPLFGDEEVDKFIRMTGITETRRASEHQTASDLGYTAAKKLIESRGIDPDEIDALVFGTVSPDYRRPASAFVLQKRLGLSVDTAVFDINLGCSSFVYGFQVAASMMASSDIRKTLLIVGDTAAKTTSVKDRASIMLVGDGSAAVLIERDEKAEPIDSLVRSDGTGYRYLIVPAGGYRNLHASPEPFMFPDGNERSLHHSCMQGTSVFTFTISDVPKLLRDYLEKTGTTVEDYDVFAFHQANLYILKQIAKKLKIPEEKMPLSIFKFGNTSGASPLITLCDRCGGASNRLRALFCSFGVGLSWGTFGVTLDAGGILPVIEDDTVFTEGIINKPEDLFS
jgi:3-oxoacyl-[acyl-carrier-protein] synthase-3